MNLSNWDVSKATSFNNMFYYTILWPGCDLNRWDTSSVTNLETMFAYSSNPDISNIKPLNHPSITLIYRISNVN